MVEFDVVDFQPEIKGKEFCFASMGSGQIYADPLMAFLRKAFWDNYQELPTVTFAKLLIYWVLQEIIQINSGGIGGDIHLAVLKNEGNKPYAHEFSQEELAETKECVDDILKYMLKYRCKNYEQALEAEERVGTSIIPKLHRQ